MAIVLNQNNIPFKVVGGTSLALRGLKIPFNDIDIEMSQDDVYCFEDIYRDCVIDAVQLREKENWRSHIGRFEITGVNVEVMGGLERRVNQVWLPSFLSTETVVMLDDIPIPVLEIEEEVLAYLRRGNLERVALALSCCNSDRLVQLLREAVEDGML